MTNAEPGMRKDLKEAAATLKWAGVDLFALADRMKATGDEQGANELTIIALSFQQVEDTLEGAHSEKGKVSQVKPYSDNVR